MNTTKRTLTALALTLGIAMLGVLGCSKPAEEVPAKVEGSNRVAKHTCPMHPEVVQDGAGKCPKCGMNLVVKK